MTLVLGYALYNFMFDDARIGHKNTYDIRVELHAQTGQLYFV